MILVTGATGLVGSHLVVKLLHENYEVKALCRKSSNLGAVKKVFKYYNCENLFDKINWIEGDITDIPALEIAIKNVTHVYHCAALISFDPKDAKKLYKINVEGTANIVNCCINFGVKKICHVSSIATLGQPRNSNEFITEVTEWNNELQHSHYALTKYGAEMEIWRGQQEGLEVVVVNPGVIFGFGFPKNGSGKIIESIKNKTKFYTKGIIATVSVEDVVSCMLKLMNSSINAERFILVGTHYKINELFNLIANVIGVTPPTIYAKTWMTNLAWRLDRIYSIVFRTTRKLTRETAASAHSSDIYCTSKIENQLKFAFTDMNKYLSNLLPDYVDLY